MECLICKNGNTFPGHVTITLERANSIIAIKNVEAEICENCGEYYLDDETTSSLLAKAEESFKKGVEIEVINMNKVA